MANEDYCGCLEGKKWREAVRYVEGIDFEDYALGNGRCWVLRDAVAKKSVHVMEALRGKVGNRYDARFEMECPEFMNKVMKQVLYEPNKYVIELLGVLSSKIPLDVTEKISACEVQASFMHLIARRGVTGIGEVVCEMECEDGPLFMRPYLLLDERDFERHEASLIARIGCIKTTVPDFNKKYGRFKQTFVEFLCNEIGNKQATHNDHYARLLMYIVQSRFPSDVVSAFDGVGALRNLQDRVLNANRTDAIEDLYDVLAMAGCNNQRSWACRNNEFLKNMRERSKVESLRTTIIRRFIICTVANSQRIKIPHYYPRPLFILTKDAFKSEQSKALHEHLSRGALPPIQRYINK